MRNFTGAVGATSLLSAALLAVLFLNAFPTAPMAKSGVWRAPLTCPLKKSGWTETRFRNRAENRLSCSSGALKIASRDSISLHALSPPSSFQKARRLNWDWRVLKSAGPSNLTRKGKDDRSIAVLVAFRYDPKSASLGERMLRPMIESRQGPSAPGRVLAYTWVEDRRNAPRAMMRSPFGGAAHRIIPLRRSVGGWRRESVDIAADYRRAFGRGPYEVQYIALASDTDDLGGMAEAMIRNLRLAR